MQSHTFTRFSVETRLIASLLLMSISFVQAQTPFYSETFPDEATALSEWTGGGENTGDEIWRWSDDPLLPTYDFYDPPPFEAPTAENGFLYFDALTNGPVEFAVTLTSPLIDASGQDRVFLRAATQYVYYFFEENFVEVGVSVDGGDFVYRDVLTSVEPVDLDESLQYITVELPEAANQANVQIQFRWTGVSAYFLKIDDIQLFNEDPTPANDLTVGRLRLPYTFAVPESQTDTFFFAGVITNNGTDPQTNVRLVVSVFDQDLNLLYQDSSESVDQLLTMGIDRDTLLEITDGFKPEATGTYFIAYGARADETDDFPQDNVQIERLLVTESTFTIDNGRTQSALQPGEFAGDFWEIGNYFFVPNGDGFEAIEATFSIASAGDSHVGKTISILLYEIEEDDDPSQFTSDDVSVVGFANHTFAEEETNFELATATLINLDDDSEGVTLKDSTEYLLMLSLPQDMFMPYAYRPLYYDIGTIVKNGDDWFLGGFGPEVAAIVRMVIRPADDVPAKEPELPDSQIHYFPNPASDWLRLDLDLSQPSAVQLQLVDLSGKTLMQREYTSLQRDQLTLDVSQLPAGAYLLKVSTAEGIKVLKTTIQR